MTQEHRAAHATAGCEVDRAVRVTVAESAAEVVGAVLMEQWGAFEQESVPAGGAQGAAAGERLVTMVFYPPVEKVADVNAALETIPSTVRASGPLWWETRNVPRDWVDGWRSYFHPVVVGDVHIRPPWEQGLKQTGPGRRDPVDVVINPGLGFGTGLHPTTRGALQLLQVSQSGTGRGALVDAGTGSGILAIAAAKLGWGPVIAFDNDAVAIAAARENVRANEVGEVVEIHEADVAEAPCGWFAGATVVANMTLEPLLLLIQRFGDLAPAPGLAKKGRRKSGAQACLPIRVVVSGLLAGAQEVELLDVAWENGFTPGQRLYEGEWVSLELVSPPSRRRSPVRPSVKQVTRREPAPSAAASQPDKIRR